MKHVRTLGLTLIAAALVGVYGCGKKEEAKPAAAPKAEAPAAKPEVVVKLGHVGPLTGPIAHLGKDNENGARMAVEDANAKGTEIDGKKIKFELLGEDDQADRRGEQRRRHQQAREALAVLSGAAGLGHRDGEGGGEREHDQEEPAGKAEEPERMALVPRELGAARSGPGLVRPGLTVPAPLDDSAAVPRHRIEPGAGRGGGRERPVGQRGETLAGVAAAGSGVSGPADRIAALAGLPLRAGTSL
ncbi:MAG: ABC transporter substrate-binding protein [Burkholderiales bacterium]|nr:MAG: ABC transporter substrate-binding protein [Burkholderiales bacterium]